MEAARSLPEPEPRPALERGPALELDLWDPATAPPAEPPRPAPAASGLPERDRRILEFEKHWWRYAGAKERAVRDEFGMSATRYYQVLNALIDSPEALVAEPMLVRRLRRLRAQRRNARAIRPPRPDVAEE
nr:DUF3263 domain-containing protein [Micromonospora sp. DSM 115978]